MASDSVSAPVETAHWNERTWEHLLESIEAQTVIPIIGPDLLWVQTGEKKTLLDRYLAAQLANSFDLRVDAAAGEPTLHNVICKLLERRRESRADISSMLCSALKKARFAPPEPLRQLAEISHFNLFVTTTCDSLLEEALNLVRFGGRPDTRWVNYRHNKEDKRKDIEADKADLPTTVYYLMGKVSVIPDYVLTDEDLLEFVCDIQLEARRPKKLFHELEENNLLLLGQNFSDWFARIFLRTAKQRPLSQSRDFLEFLADGRTSRDADLVFFLRHFSGPTRVFPHGGAVDFVAELWRRWRERNPEAAANPQEPQFPPPAEMPPGAIFISYASEDGLAAKKLKAGLDAAGLVAWYDKEQLKPGDTYGYEIENSIKRECSCFIPLLSSNTERRRKDCYFRREWDWAADRDRGNHPTQQFIVPVIVDGTDAQSLKYLDESGRFSKLHITPLPGGQVTPEFVERMKQIAQHLGAGR